MSDSLWPHESQHARPPCPSPTPGVHSDSHPSSKWCHPAILSSVVPFSSCPQSLPASESFPMSQLFAWGGQSTGVSALASFLPKKTDNTYWSLTQTQDLAVSLLSIYLTEVLQYSHQKAHARIFITSIIHNWRRKWLPTLVFLPGKFHGQRSLVGYSPWGYKELDTIAHTHIIHNSQNLKTIHIFIHSRMDKLWHPHTTGCYREMRMNYLQLHGRIWVNLASMTLRERSQTPKK